MRPGLRILYRVVLPAAVAAILALVTFVPLPYPTTIADREAALNVALDALLTGTLVNTPDGMSPLIEREFALRNPQELYFRNAARVPDSLFELHGLKPISSEAEPIFEHGGAIISAGRTRPGQSGRHLLFDYTFGFEGAQGYEIRIYKSLLERRIVFVHAWVS